jgi:hypothetical protein
MTLRGGAGVTLALVSALVLGAGVGLQHDHPLEVAVRLVAHPTPSAVALPLQHARLPVHRQPLRLRTSLAHAELAEATGLLGDLSTIA